VVNDFVQVGNYFILEVNDFIPVGSDFFGVKKFPDKNSKN
jgi:hypothetical protein